MADAPDPQGTDKSQAATPAKNDLPDLGDGLFDADQAPADLSRSDDGSSGEATQEPTDDQPSVEQQETDWSKVNLETVDPDSLPDHLRPAADVVRRLRADYTRKTQDLAEQRRSLDDVRKQIAEERQQYLEAIQGIRSAPQDGSADPFQRLAQNLTPEEQQGLRVVDELLNTRLGSELKPLREQLDGFKQLQTTVQQLQQTLNQQRAQVVQNELAVAQEAFGEDVVERYRPLLLRNYGQVNPQTSKAYTISELVGLFSGVSAQEAQNARQAARNGRSQAKTQARQRPAVSGVEGDGDLSQGQLMEEMGKLFGGR